MSVLEFSELYIIESTLLFEVFNFHNAILFFNDKVFQTCNTYVHSNERFQNKSTNRSIECNIWIKHFETLNWTITKYFMMMIKDSGSRLFLPYIMCPPREQPQIKDSPFRARQIIKDSGSWLFLPYTMYPRGLQGSKLRSRTAHLG